MIADIDHRETALSAKAFEAAFRFITGAPPARVAVVPESRVVLDGQVAGLGLNNQPGKGDFANNLPLVGATVEVYTVNESTGERSGPPVHRKVIGADGLWGPFTADPKASHEFVVSAPGYAVTHIYRSPFPRSSALVHMRPARLAPADKDAGSVVTMTRPRGYFGVGRDRMSLDGQSPPPGLAPGVAGTATSTVRLKETAARAVVADFNGEQIVARSWPAKENHVVFAEFHY